MAVELTGTSKTFVGTGVLSNYTPEFYARTADQVHVYVDDVIQTLGDDYTLSGLADEDGVAVSATFPLNAVVYVERLTPITQEVDTQNNETILEDVLDAEFDKLTMIDQEQQGQLDRALKVPKGVVSSIIPDPSLYPGMFLTAVAGGDWVFSSGTGGGDAALRADLNSVASGASLVLYRPFGLTTGAGRTVTRRLSDELSVKDRGAVGDFATDDSANLAAIITFSQTYAQYPAGLFLPSGRFYHTQALAAGDHFALRGSGVSSVLNNQGKGVNAPHIVNSNPYGLLNFELSDMTMLGGTGGIKMTAASENADLFLLNVSSLIHADNGGTGDGACIYASKLLQDTLIISGSYGSAKRFLHVPALTTNNFLSIGAKITQLTDETTLLVGGQGVGFIGGRNEGGGVTGKIVHNWDTVETPYFIGQYLENIHSTLVKARNHIGGIPFQAMHFTGTDAGTNPIGLNGKRAFDWDVGDTVVTIRDSNSGTLQKMPKNARFEGENTGFCPSDVTIRGTDWTGTKHRIARRVPNTGIVPLFRFTRPLDGQAANLQVVTGTIDMSLIALTAGGFKRSWSRRIRFHVDAVQAGFPMTGAFAADGADFGDLLAGATATFAFVNAANETIDTQVTFSFDPSGDTQSKFMCSVHFDRNEGVPLSGIKIVAY